MRKVAQVERNELASVTSPAPAPRERFSDVLERLPDGRGALGRNIEGRKK